VNEHDWQRSRQREEAVLQLFLQLLFFIVILMVKKNLLVNPVLM